MVERGAGVGVGEQLGQEDLSERKVTSKMLTSSYMGVQAWLMTSRHTDPDLHGENLTRSRCWDGISCS
jgi:hypothetical protein